MDKDPVLQLVKIETELLVMCKPDRNEVDRIVRDNIEEHLTNLDSNHCEIISLPVTNLSQIPHEWFNAIPFGETHDRTCSSIWSTTLTEKELEQIKQERDKNQMKLDL